MGTVDELLDGFDFERVHKAMVAVEWKWRQDDEELRVPTMSELRACARDLAERVLDSDAESISTGGLTVRRTSENFEGWERKFIEIDFCLDSHDVEIHSGPV